MTAEIPPKKDRPDNMDRAMDMLRRQHYGDVADYIEENL